MKHHSDRRAHRVERRRYIELSREAEALESQREAYVLPLTRSLAQRDVHVCAAGCTQRVSREGEVCFVCWKNNHPDEAA